MYTSTALGYILEMLIKFSVNMELYQLRADFRSDFLIALVEKETLGGNSKFIAIKCFPVGH